MAPAAARDVHPSPAKSAATRVALGAAPPGLGREAPCPPQQDARLPSFADHDQVDHRTRSGAAAREHHFRMNTVVRA